MSWLSLGRTGLTGILFLLGLLFYSQSAFAYFIVNDGNTFDIDPIVGNESASAYYNYQPNSGDPAFGPEKDKGFFWLYRQTGSEDIQLGVIFNVDGGRSSAGDVDMIFFNLPATADTVHVEDDGDEISYNQTDEVFEGDWYWSMFADGGVIGDFEADPSTDWEIHVAVGNEASTEFSWYFLSSDWQTNKYGRPLNFYNDGTLEDSGSLANIQLRINSGEAQVPLPGAVWLLVSGLAGVSVLKKWRR